jgi:hypothetical protein
MPTPIPSGKIREEVRRAVQDCPVLDIHTHLYDLPFGSLLLWGIDELLTYHYLVAEVFRAAPMPYEKFWAMSKVEQADHIWKHLFLERSPVSEACRGVLTVLQELGLDVASRDLKSYRQFFRATNAREHVDRVFKTANLRAVVMTNDPFDPLERSVWEKGVELDPRWKAVLRMDPILINWETTSEILQSWGYQAFHSLDEDSQKEVRRFLSDWIAKMKPVYMAVSLTPEFYFPDFSTGTTLLDRCILPVAREHNLPFAMMIGVKRQANPALKLAGDAVGRSDVSSVERICARYPENKFLVTMLARENQHELCVAARKFHNLMIFGCWWFTNNPSIIEEITRQRVELLGLTMIPQHSDARVLDQVLYKWKHSKAIIAHVLADKYEDIDRSGWRVTREEIERDAALLFGGNFEKFLDLKL